MITYASLPRFRERLGLAADTTEDTRLLLALRHATAQIDRYTARRFAPVVQTRRYVPRQPYTLRLEIYLLALHALTLPDGTAADLASVRLLPEGDGAKVAIVLPAGGPLRFTTGAAPDAAVTVTGTWGTHTAWSEAWLASGDTVQAAPLAADATTIAVADAAGADGLGLAPRFSAGQLLRLGEEYLHVIGVEANTLHVIRGVRGTEAASHPAGTPLAIYAPPPDVQALCLRWAAWLYQQVNASIGAGADWLYPPDLPDDLYRLAAPLRHLRVA
ncbi:MAG: hypothetical protein JXN59_03735 [Anaerolineae bacterium]|nr:hypothetical protein [Anaerolineae bacterium]